MPVYDMSAVLKMPQNNNKPIKVIIFPTAELEQNKRILNIIKNHIETYPQTTFIILNTFCDMSVPNMIYRFRMSNVILINLFVIANDRRFR